MAIPRARSSRVCGCCAMQAGVVGRLQSLVRRSGPTLEGRAMGMGVGMG